MMVAVPRRQRRPRAVVHQPREADAPARTARQLRGPGRSDRLRATYARAAAIGGTPASQPLRRAHRRVRGARSLTRTRLRSPTTRPWWDPSRRALAPSLSSIRSRAEARSRTRPKTSSPVPSLFEERADAGGAFLQPRRLRREKVFRCASTRWPHNALAHEAGQPAVIIGTKRADWFESRHGSAAVHDQHRRATLHAVDQRTEIVLGFGDTRLLHDG